MVSPASQNAWVELEKRCGQIDGASIFEVHRDSCSISQNNLSIANLFVEIKKLQDEYTAITIIPHCNYAIECATLVTVHKMLENHKLMQFLVGLNEQYKTIRENLIMVKPLPTLSQAYNVIL